MGNIKNIDFWSINILEKDACYNDKNRNVGYIPTLEF